MDTVKRPAQRQAAMIAQLLSHERYVFVAGRLMTNLLAANAHQVMRFRSCWNHLERDRYMADGGRYRFRRYGQFCKTKVSKQIVMLPHEPYVQPSYINPLNGDIERHFEPLTDCFVASPILEKLLLLMSQVYDQAQGQPTDWNIRLHPYRIVANKYEQGEPTPEGLHRDGVTYIASLMINHSNICGGRTQVTDEQGQLLESIRLDKTFDLVMADDARTMHQVSAITPENPEKCAYRDVLVIAFTKMEE